MKAVDIQELTKFYGSSRGIQDITFSIEEGEVFGFIGPNGAGKSTTIRTLLNFIYPTSGRATILGKDIVRDSVDIRRMVGYLPSEVHYYDDMKAVDLLRYSASFYGKVDEPRMKKLAEQLDLDLGRKIEKLSFGNRKKVGIIQAMLHAPRLLILDEPTGGLDPLMQHTFFELLEEERQKGVTVFFSSHILSEVQKVCDRVAIIKQGELLKVESVSNLTRSRLKKVMITLEPGMSDYAIRLEGIMNQERDGQELRLLFNGDIKQLLSELGHMPLVDIRIEEPSLEEVFMHYYER
jgi:ABC-2 type transport system ATP-binding protein